VLILVATLILILSVLTTWVHRQMLNEDNWRKASEELVQDPAVRNAVSVYVVNELYDNVDLSAVLGEQLPENLKPLAGPAAAAARQPLTDGVKRLLESPRVQQLFVNASALAQQKLVNVLEDKTGYGISTGDGVVTLDLSALVKELGADLGISASTLDRIPSDTGVITIMESDKLATAQAGVQALRILSVVLFVLVFGLYALAIYLARGERRRVLRNVGWALIVSGLIVLVCRRLAGNYVIDQLTTPESEPAGRRAWLIGSEILAQIGWASVLYGVMVALGAMLAGPTAAATSVRRAIAPVLNDRPAIAWTVVAIAYLLLVLWGPTHALRVAWGIVLLAALLAAGVFALRRETLREFPNATEERDPRPIITRIREAAPVRGNGNGHDTAASPAAEIAQLNELHASGAITDEEYERAKQLALR
jgi:putative oligomerization/nucleic acid binding protein